MRNGLVLSLILASSLSYAADPSTFGAELCQSNSEEYRCLTVQQGDTWEKLWQDVSQRDLVKRANRTNVTLVAGQVLAVPKDLENTTIFDIAPFPKHIVNSERKLIIVDQSKLAWVIYDAKGDMQWWGPASSGRDKCSDSNKVCRTITGKYYIFDKKSTDCVSNKFPLGEGGAKMPYCMYFFKGFALHGSSTVPGFRDSHGCVRLFTEDAKWLNEKYIDLPKKENNYLGTKVIIKEL